MYSYMCVMPVSTNQSSHANNHNFYYASTHSTSLYDTASTQHVYMQIASIHAVLSIILTHRYTSEVCFVYEICNEIRNYLCVVVEVFIIPESQAKVLIL